MKPREPWVPYVAPFGVYMLFLLIQSRFDLQALIWLYPIKTIATAITLVLFWKYYDELKWDRRSIPRDLFFGVLVGTVAIVIWIGIDGYYPHISRLFGHLTNLVNAIQGQPKITLSEPEFFDPHVIQSEAARWMFISFRVFGAVVVVAFMEEIFWRGFLIRFLIDENFKRIPMGMFTWSSFGLTVLFFGLEDDQWLAGVICGALYNWLYYRTKSLPACVIAHGTSNALLAAWVLYRGDWKFW